MTPLIPRVVASQLARPHGLLAKKTMDLLDAGNAERITACVDQTQVGPGMSVADVGFGGGVGLRILLDRVASPGVGEGRSASPGGGGSAPGRVHGVELSTSAIRRARRRFRSEIDDGLLAVHEGTLQASPLPDDSLDALISTNTVYFVPDLAPVRDELVRLTSPGGRIVLGIADPAKMREIGMPLHGFTLRPVDQIVETMTTTSALEVTGRDQLDDRVGFTVVVLSRR